MATNYGGIGGKPMAPVFNPALATSFYANPANRGKSVTDLWNTLPTFNSWEDAARGDFGSSNPAFANLGDEGRSNLLRDVYGLSSDYKVANGAIVRAKPAQWKVAAGTLGAMIGGPLLYSALAGGGAAAGAGAAAASGAGASTAAAGAGATAAGLGTAAGTAAATGGGMTLGSVLGSPLLSAGVSGATQLYGARQAQKGLTAQMQFEREREAQAQRQWEAQQAFQQQQFAAQEEERAFQRQRAEFDQREVERRIALDQAREQRQAPYRAASQAALGRLGNLLGLRL